MESLPGSVIDELRPIVGMNGWDYCVLWKPSQDQSCFEWMGCCCAGAVADQSRMVSSSNHGGGGGQEQAQLFPWGVISASATTGCRDFSFLHPRTEACEALAEIPSTIPLASSPGIHAEAFLSNQSKWISVPNRFREAVTSNETRVLVPVSGGLLVELFASKKVAEDQNVVELVMAATKGYRYNSTSTTGAGDAACRYEHVEDALTPSLFLNHLTSKNEPPNDTESWAYTAAVDGTPNCTNFPWDLSLDASLLRQRSQQLEEDQEGCVVVGSFFEGSADSIVCGRPQQLLGGPAVGNLVTGIDQQTDNDLELQNLGMAAGYNPMNAMPEMGEMAPNVVHASVAESTVLSGGDMDVDQDKASKANRRVDWGSDGSNQEDDDDEHKAADCGKGGRSGQSKNLMAERRRRKKLNDRLLTLRSLVPNISKLVLRIISTCLQMDRASILGDAIDYVKKLDQQVKELRAELEKVAPEDDQDHDHQEKRAAAAENQAGSKHGANGKNNHDPTELMLIQMSANPNDPADQQDVNHLFPSLVSSKTITTGNHLPRQHSKATHTVGQDNVQNQMEVQVEVFQVSRNEFFVKVFCEHKAGGFVRLMEAMNSLGLEVTNANVTTFRPLVLSVFKVEKRDNQVVEAEQVRESLLELTREPNGEWQTPLANEHELQQLKASNQYHHHQYNSRHHHQHQQQQLILHYLDHR